MTTTWHQFRNYSAATDGETLALRDGFGTRRSGGEVVGVLDAKEKAMWKDLLIAFKKKWPVPVETAETMEELKARIKDTVLRREDLGKTVGPPGDEMPTHLRWVVDMKPLIESIKDPTMLLKGDVRGMLPLEFFTAVESLDSESIWDELERSVRNDGGGGLDSVDRDAALCSCAAPAPHVMYPTVFTLQCTPAAQQQQTTAQPSAYCQPQNQAQPVTPQWGPPPHMSPVQVQSSVGNLFAPSPYQQQLPTRFMQSLLLGSPGSPLTGCGTRNSLGGDPVKDLTIAKCTAAAPRTYEQTAAGVQQYQADLAAWDATYSPMTGVSPDCTTFPLTPGMLPAGSKECWTCGLIANPPHFGATRCRQSGSTLVLQCESNVHTLVSNTLFLPGEHTPCFLSVSQIMEDTYNPIGVFNMNQILFDEQEDPEQGNGEGLA
ncbi:hypothetical protein B0H10DRAFT_2230021 [Mycena sp. CBHHK59/15]|nr:hypothetical protein B0H10DRAFT_2230021 [Mycena sp. CBHHK59/15]